MNTEQHARIAKFQKLWRSKRVFSNSQGSWKVSPAAITTQIVTFKLPTNFRVVFDSTPKGFTEVTGYQRAFAKPVVRWDGGRWIGESDDINKVIAKRGKQTIVLTDKYFDVMGVGNYEEALLAIVKNGWAPKLLLHAKPLYKKIDGIFYVNKPFHLDDLADALRQLPDSFGAQVKYTQKDVEWGVPAVVLKLSNPKWTYQFFKNGTVLFTGIKDPSEIDAPRKLFKEFFSEYGLAAILAINLAKSPAIGKPRKGGNSDLKKAALANRYPLAKSWNVAPPHGFYVRPGTNGRPRLYKWRKMEKEMQTGEILNRGAMGLGKKNAVVVAKAFAKAGVAVPPPTLKIFANLGIPISNVNGSPGPSTGMKNRRAPSWNATKPGFYVRPGPGKQPYWFKIPSGVAAGRKTVIKTYSDAGRNIPAAVRQIFKIPANVRTNVLNVGGEEYKKNIEHFVTMGLNKILRINNRQATRLTKAELLAIARNMNIPEANSGMKPARLIQLIQNKAGVKKPIRNYDVLVNSTFYRFLNNGRLEKTSSEGIQTRRAWNTISTAEQNKIANKLLPANLHGNYNATAKVHRFNTLRAFIAGKKPAPAPAPPSPVPAPPSPANSASSSISNNFGIEAEYMLRISSNLGNMYKNGNELNFMKRYGKIPVGARGKPPAAKVEAVYKKFIKETRAERKNMAPRVRYTARISVPNWLPQNKVQAYKNLVTNLAFQKPKPKVADVRTAVKAWLNREVPRSPARAAHNVENMVTGEMKRVPAYVPKARKTPPIPKRSPAPKKSPKAKAAPKIKMNSKKTYVIPVTENVENLGNAMIAAGLNVGTSHSWNAVVRAGVNKKFKNTWAKYVAV